MRFHTATNGNKVALAGAVPLTEVGTDASHQAAPIAQHLEDHVRTSSATGTTVALHVQYKDAQLQPKLGACVTCMVTRGAVTQAAQQQLKPMAYAIVMVVAIGGYKLVPTQADPRPLNPYEAETSQAVSSDAPQPLQKPTAPCTAPGCNSTSKAHGLCAKHGGNRCSEPGCTTAARSNSLCIRHGGGRCSVPGCT